MLEPTLSRALGLACHVAAWFVLGGLTSCHTALVFPVFCVGLKGGVSQWRGLSKDLLALSD